MAFPITVQAVVVGFDHEPRSDCHIAIKMGPINYIFACLCVRETEVLMH